MLPFDHEQVHAAVPSEVIMDVGLDHFLVLVIDLIGGAVLVSMAGGFNVDLFGSILTVSGDDLLFVLILAAVVLGFALVFYKELLHMTFDEPGARLAGVPVSQMDLVSTIVVALTVVISIKIVGSLLVSSLLIIPSASAMQLSRSFKGTMVEGRHLQHRCGHRWPSGVVLLRCGHWRCDRFDQRGDLRAILPSETLLIQREDLDRGGNL
jgi:hypothetical protein